VVWRLRDHSAVLRTSLLLIAEISICSNHSYIRVATAALSPGDIAWPIRSIFRSRKNVTVLVTEISGVDIEARAVTDGQAVVPFDFLILATGAAHSYFGHDQWPAFAPAL
jgi:NADH:ubiquinone reductase (H+-translocating)